MRSLSRMAVCGGFMLLSLASVALPCRAEYLAYAVLGDDGKDRKPLPENLDTIAKKRPVALCRIAWSSYEGPKTRIRVLETSNESGQQSATVHVTGPGGESYSWSYDVDNDFREVPVSGLDAILTDVLTQTGRFRVVERGSLGAMSGSGVEVPKSSE